MFQGKWQMPKIISIFVKLYMGFGGNLKQHEQERCHLGSNNRRQRGNVLKGGDAFRNVCCGSPQKSKGSQYRKRENPRNNFRGQFPVAHKTYIHATGLV